MNRQPGVSPASGLAPCIARSTGAQQAIRVVLRLLHYQPISPSCAVPTAQTSARRTVHHCRRLAASSAASQARFSCSKWYATLLAVARVTPRTVLASRWERVPLQCGAAPLCRASGGAGRAGVGLQRVLDSQQALPAPAVHRARLHPGALVRLVLAPCMRHASAMWVKFRKLDNCSTVAGGLPLRTPRWALVC